MTDLLSELGEKYGTDKVRDHHYTPHYHRRFDRMRGEPITLLEIGVGGYASPETGGDSLRMWRDYFPEGTIVGLDIAEKHLDLGPRVHIRRGEQADNAVLNALGEEFGPFDVIIDDGSHRPDDILRSWVTLWNYLKMGGWYCIEDLGTAYWPPFGGSSLRTGDTTIGFLQGLIDRLHWVEFDIPNYHANRFDKTVVGLELARNIAFILKGDNTLPSRWMPEHPHPERWPEIEGVTYANEAPEV